MEQGLLLAELQLRIDASDGQYRNCKLYLTTVFR